MASSTSAAALSLPQGGGALKGLGEKFSPDLQSGAGHFSIPLALPPGRNGFEPQLALAYSTGYGNGPFGLGWTLSVPGVARQTSQGVPRYDDGNDVFILSGLEDLVPVETSGAFTRYRPRTEGLFARILHHRDAANSYWEVRSKDGHVSVYGTKAAHGNDPAAVADPDARTKVFAWRLTRTEDPCGNLIEYEYERDLGKFGDDGPHRWDQLYLSRIRYIDHGSDGANPKFLVSVTFTYAPRPDPFSDGRAGFEIRTRRRCTRIAVRMHDNAAADRLVRTYDLTYADERPELAASRPLNGVSLLSLVTVTGHDGAATETLPPIECRYTAFEPAKRDFFPVEGTDLPAQSLADPDLALVDLFGRGLPDVLEMNGTVRYWRNLGRGRFDLPRFMTQAPGGVALANPGVQLVDADGDGRTDLLVTTGAISGYFPLTNNGGWDARSFRRYRQAPSFSLSDPEVRLVDLDGDGITDALRSGARFECFFSDPDLGWHDARTVERRAADVFPNVTFADSRVRLADMTGDGLQDVAFVSDGSVEYWPNRGHGTWGHRVRMARSPRFPYGHDPQRILVGDVDGDGLADLVYVDHTTVTVWINQSGNGWSDPITIRGTPPVTDADGVRLVDLLGSGIAGVLWTRRADGVTRERFLFLDLAGSQKPYLLREIDNHMGASTTITYAPSTQFYLEDQQQRDRRWKTSAPFPVHVVSRVQVADHFSKNTLTTDYRYHHGYWDGVEHEFRGFGMVEQFDTEIFAAAGPGAAPQFHSPPTMTRTWFHQGPVDDGSGDWQELDWSDQYWGDDPPLLQHTEQVNRYLRSLPPGPDVRRMRRDALRALRGSVLRTELYALDGSPREHRPYTVSESSYGLVEIDPPSDSADRRLRVSFPHQIAQRTTQWERGTDPMTSVSFTRYRRTDADPVDPFGRPIGQTNIACPRGWRGMDDRPAEGYLATYAVTEYAAPTSPGIYIHDRVASTTSFELTGTGAKTVAELAALMETSAGATLIGHSRQFYDGAAFVGLPRGQVGSRGLLTRTETLALTDDVLQEAYGADVPPYLEPTGTPAWTAEYPTEFRALLSRRAGYRFDAGSASVTNPAGYFITNERHRYDVHTDPNGRGLRLETLDPLHDAAADPLAHRSATTYDAFQLLPIAVTDAAGLTLAAVHDYRVLRPSEVTDANGNATRFTYSPLGLLTSTSVRGKSAAEGDQLRPSLRLEYAFRAFDQSPPAARQPIYVRTTQHVHHDSRTDVPTPARDETIATIEYSDGFGRMLQTRRQDDDVRFGDARFGGGDAVVPSVQTAGAGGDVAGHLNASATAPNVAVSGWHVYDNKGRVVEQYEPFFAEGWAYGQPGEASLGQKLTRFYDPRGHVVHTRMPDGSEHLAVQGVPGRIAAPDLDRPDAYEPTPWELYSYDANDNAGRTHPAASARYRHHWNTPSSIRVDALGRTVEAIERNRDAPPNAAAPLPPIQEVRTQTRYDIRGNVLAVIDAAGRTAVENTIDLINRTLRAESIDAGIRRAVPDAVGGIVEVRTSNGSLALGAFDGLTRPIRLWARDRAGEAITLRERREYGDAGTVAQPAADRAAARAINTLGRATRVLDEAGQLTFDEYDFKGNVTAKTRRVVSDAALLGVFAGPPAGWNVPAFRVDWTSVSGTQLEAKAYTSTLVHDALNRATQLTHPEDVEGTRRESAPGYGPSGALRAVTLGGTTFVERIAYNAKGQRVLIAYGNGIMTRYAYDPRTFRLVRLRTERFTTPAPLTYRPTGPVLQDLAYEYDLAGNVLDIHDRTPGSGIPGTAAGADALDRVFVYDALSRLRSATGRECDHPPTVPWDDTPRCVDLTRVRACTEQYTLDLMGNLTGLTHSSGASIVNSVYAMPAASNRVQTFTRGSDVFAYEYDANGSLTREATSRHLEWDHHGRVRVYRTQTAGSEPTVHAQYLYDSTGTRVKKFVRKPGNRVEITVTVDGVFEHERLVTGGATVENNTLHVMDDRARIAAVRVGPAFADDVMPAVKYHLADHLGSSTVVVDAAGSFVNREEYTPYGSTSFGSAARKRFRFGGHERDSESDLYYGGARYYLPWLGRWASCDPAGTVDGLNLYVYVRNNPLVLRDPTGTNGENDYGGTLPPGGLPDPSTTSHEKPEDHDASPPAPPEPPPPPPPAAPTPEQVYAAQQKAAYERSKAARNSTANVTKSLLRAVAPTTFSVMSPAPQLEGVAPGIAAMTDPGAQDDVAVAGGNVAKKTVEYGGTAATIAGDVGLAGVQVGVKTVGAITAKEVVKQAPARAAPQMVARAAEVHKGLAQHMSMHAAEKTTVAVTRATVDGTTHTVITVNTKKGHTLLEKGIVELLEHETLGMAPSRFNTWFRRFWTFTNRHAEELGIRTLKRMGAKGGEVATAPWAGCWRCQTMIDRLNRMFGDKWVHVNPSPNGVLK